MEKITSLIQQLNSLASQRNVPLPAFVEGEIFSWNHTSRTITYNPIHSQAVPYLLHEFCHALLSHATYTHDVSLLKMESEAWHQAEALARELDIVIDSTLIELSLDTYRDWLHSRSLCPQCTSTGLQDGASAYRCLSCRHTWRVNEARTCELRRYSTQKTP